MSAGLENGTLLLGRLLLAGCFLPSGIARLTNISGFAASLSLKGLPFPDVLAALGVLAEVFGPIALILGLAPRLTSLVLVAFTVVTTATLHRWWDFVGLARQAEQAIFLAHLGLLAGLMLYLVTGPGAWSVRGWRRAGAEPRKAAPPRKRATPGRAPRAASPGPA